MSEMIEGLWLRGQGEYPDLHAERCWCGNPIVGVLPLPAECEQHSHEVCALVGCGDKRMSRYVLCSAHAKRRYRHGSPLWERGPVGYRAMHMRLGSVSGRPCRDCGQPARDWSYIGGDPAELCDIRVRHHYSLDPDYYEPRCRSCHLRLDGLVSNLLGRSAA